MLLSVEQVSERRAAQESPFDQDHFLVAAAAAQCGGLRFPRQRSKL
jgi:hypothetical protein